MSLSSGIKAKAGSLVLRATGQQCTHTTLPWPQARREGVTQQTLMASGREALPGLPGANTEVQGHADTNPHLPTHCSQRPGDIHDPPKGTTVPRVSP